MGLSDSVTARKVYRASGLSDDFSSALSDVPVYKAKTLFTMSDALALTDNVDPQMPVRGSMSDALAMSDAVAPLVPMLGQSTDSFAPTDSASALAKILGQPSDSFTPTDSASALMLILASISDDGSLDLTDLVSYNLVELELELLKLQYSMSDSFAPTDSVDVLFPYLAAMGDSLGLADGVLALFIYNAQIGDELSLLEDLATYNGTGALPLYFNFSDGLILSDEVKAIGRLKRGMSDSFIPQDSVSPLFKHLANFGDAELIYDSANGRAVEGPFVRRVRVYAANGMNLVVYGEGDIDIRTLAQNGLNTRSWIE
jgi:hypothetical protein